VSIFSVVVSGFLAGAFVGFVQERILRRYWQIHTFWTEANEMAGFAAVSAWVLVGIWSGPTEGVSEIFGNTAVLWVAMLVSATVYGAVTAWRFVRLVQSQASLPTAGTVSDD
jgi:hypothetical protein